MQKQIPLVLSGLILGLFGLSNLLLSYHPFILHALSLFACVLWILYTLTFIMRRRSAWQEIQNTTLFTSCAPYPMATMLFANYLSILGLTIFSKMLWWAGAGIHILMFSYCSFYLIRQEKKLFVTPSWTVLYVGIAMMGLTNPVTGARALGWGSILLGFILTLVLTPFILKNLPQLKDPIKPQVAILCAPFSLLLAASIKMANSSIPEAILYALVIASQLFYFLALVWIPKALKKGFYPSYSALTFPLVISATSFKLALPLLGWEHTLPAQILLKAEEGLATLVVAFVAYQYFLYLKDSVEASN